MGLICFAYCRCCCFSSFFFLLNLKAAQAQESLEEESLAEVEAEVREELGLTLSGNEVCYPSTTNLLI